VSRGVVVDGCVIVAGAVVGVASVAVWLAHGGLTEPTLVLAPFVVALLAQFPLVISQRTGDVVIGFECSVLVFLTLVTTAVETNALWALGVSAAFMLQRKSWRTRGFNVGLTNLLGPIAVSILDRNTLHGDPWDELGIVVLGCAVYFLLDLLLTAASLVADGFGTSLLEAVPLRSIPLPLACFVSIDSIGYLAGVIHQNERRELLVLLLVPLATIIVAARAVTVARLHERRMSGLFVAAKSVGALEDTAALDEELVRHAQAVLRHSEAVLSDEPPRGQEIGVRVSAEGRPDRWLVVRRGESSGQYFDADDERALEALVAVATESLERRRLVEEMAHLARHDPLTALANRALLAERLTHALARRDRLQRRVAVLYLDLDGFKGVNDRYGHEAGDRLLVDVALRLTACCRAADTLARLGGDEFAVLLEDVTRDTDVLDVAARVLTAVAHPFYLDGAEVGLGTSIGVAFARAGDTGADLLRNADLALYRAKALGRGRIEVFQPALRDATLRRLELEEELRRALDDEGAVEVHYQPIVDLATGAVVGFEALARWSHDRLGAVAPDVFVAAAERIGLIDRLGERILRRAMRDGEQLAAAAGRRLAIAVNVSAAQLADPGFRPFVAGLVGESRNVDLVLELTEGTLLGDDDETAAALTGLCAAGVQLAVDDFGVGFSSISYLHRLPVKAVKIDRSFVQRVPGDPRANALVVAVTAMAEALGLGLVAEGIEHPDAAAFVRSVGCARGQGFLFGSPCPLPEALVAAAASYDVRHLDVIAPREGDTVATV
jgi:diguanylate cyclase (GGDEF)-like protein